MRADFSVGKYVSDSFLSLCDADALIQRDKIVSSFSFRAFVINARIGFTTCESGG
jgi:hypothetical protein